MSNPETRDTETRQPHAAIAEREPEATHAPDRPDGIVFRRLQFHHDEPNAGERFRRERLDAVADFLYEHLGRYGDPREHIVRCLRYASGERAGQGGSVTLAEDHGAEVRGTEDRGRIVGAVVTNRTNMGGYIPENVLVYVAVDADQRGRGVGGRLMERALDELEGDVALHVEADNPAVRLYERLGFAQPYLEMRLKR